MKHYFKVTQSPIKIKKRNFLWSFFVNMNMTSWLIGLNILFFIIFGLMGVLNSQSCSDSICKFVALQPNNLFLGGYWWTLLTSMFMHAGFIHLFVNMISLYSIGIFLEMLIGKKRFFWLYILSGIFAGVFFSIFAFLSGNDSILIRIFGSSETYALGASGAIFALAGVLAVLTPRNKIYLLAGPLLAIIGGAVIGSLFKSEVIYNYISTIINIYIIFSLIAIFSFSNMRKLALPIELRFKYLPWIAIVPLFIIGFFLPLPIGNMAHLGGFIAGVLYGLYLRKRYKKKTMMIEEYFS